MIDKLVRNFIEESAEQLRKNVRKAGKVATGKTVNSIRTFYYSPYYAFIDVPSYFPVLETGRGPGKQPPVSSIEQWVASGVVDIKKSIESDSWGIAKSIAQKGTKLWREGGRKDIFTPVLSEERFKKLNKDIADESLTYILNGFT